MLRKAAVFLAMIAFATSCTSAEPEGQDFGPSTPPPTESAEPIEVRIRTVAVKDNMFEPKSIEIRAGDPVEWVWGGVEGGETSNPHNVVADNGGFRSGSPQKSGSPFPWPGFSAAGTFTYHCEVHGGENGFGMSGTVIVKAS